MNISRAKALRSAAFLGALIASMTSVHATAPLTACPSVITPSGCYRLYLDAIQRASTLDELHPFLTAERVKVLTESLARARARGVASAQIERATLEMLKRGAAPVARIRAQTFEGEASLWVERSEVTVEVRLILERGGWRIAEERFRSTPQR